MKRNSFLAALAVGLLSTISQAAIMKPMVIYGEDNRVDVYSEKSVDLRDISDSTVAMIANSLIRSSGNNQVAITTKNYGTEYGLCKDEPFVSQPTAADCSGSLIGEDLVMTAGHCISAGDCASNSFVFGFKMQDEKTAPLTVSADDVYRCKQVIAREETNNQDYAVVKLDRPVRGHRVLTLSKTPTKVGDALYVIGHPAGLPTKIAAGAKVRALKKGFFTTNLDTYGGNSGSAVFSSATNEIVGILVRGERDFVYDNIKLCDRSNYCLEDSCRGEDVTNIEYVIKALKL